MKAMTILQCEMQNPVSCMGSKRAQISYDLVYNQHTLYRSIRTVQRMLVQAALGT